MSTYTRRGGEDEGERERKTKRRWISQGNTSREKGEYMDSTASVERETVLPINPRDPSIRWRD
jgi:hypothetical protein